MSKFEKNQLVVSVKDISSCINIAKDTIVQVICCSDDENMLVIFYPGANNMHIISESLFRSLTQEEYSIAKSKFSKATRFNYATF